MYVKVINNGPRCNIYSIYNMAAISCQFIVTIERFPIVTVQL